MNNFKYALTLLDILYGITMQEDQFEEVAGIGWNLIGNKRVRLYRYKTSTNDCSEGVELPCNCDQIEAVTTNFEEWAYTTNDRPNGDLNSAFTEAYIEHRKFFKHPLYASGKFIKYERVGNTLYFDHPHGEINILYKGVILDDDGLPEITDKEATALATYCAYVTKYKEGIKTNNSNIISLAENLKKKWNTQCNQARADRYLSQNEWDQILDARTNWARKQFNRSFKLYK